MSRWIMTLHSQRRLQEGLDAQNLVSLKNKTYKRGIICQNKVYKQN